MHNQPTPTPTPPPTPARAAEMLAQHDRHIAPLRVERDERARILESARAELARVIERFDARACTDEEYIAERTRAELAQTRFDSANAALTKAEAARQGWARQQERAPVVAQLGALAREADKRRAAFIGRYEEALRNFAGELSEVEGAAVAYVDACASFDASGAALLDASDPEQRRAQAAALVAEVAATTGASTEAVSTSATSALLRASEFVQGHSRELGKTLDLVQVFPETKQALLQAFEAKLQRRAAAEARAVQEIEQEKQREARPEAEAAAMQRNRFLAGFGY